MVRDLFKAFCRGDICSPSEFWSLRPGEVLWLLQSQVENAKAASDADMNAELLAILRES